MAQKIVFNYTEMDNAVTAIKELSAKYVEASTAFQTAMTAAVEGWEGTSRDKFMAFITGAVKTHMGTNVPNMVTGIATLLDNNATAMKQADDQVGNNMPTSL